MPWTIWNHQDRPISCLSQLFQISFFILFYFFFDGRCRQVHASQHGLSQLSELVAAKCAQSPLSLGFFFQSLVLWSLLFPTAAWMLLLPCAPPAGQTSVQLAQQEQPPIPTEGLPKQIVPVREIKEEIIKQKQKPEINKNHSKWNITLVMSPSHILFQPLLTFFSVCQ